MLKQGARGVGLGLIGVCAALIALLALRSNDDDAPLTSQTLARSSTPREATSASARASPLRAQGSAPEQRPETATPAPNGVPVAAAEIDTGGNRQAVARQDAAPVEARRSEDPSEASKVVERDPGADDERSMPDCWVAVSNLPQMYYAVARDRRQVWSGDSSARFSASDDRAQHGMLQQTVDARAFAGKRLELSAFIRTESATSGVKVWLIAVNSQGTIVAESGTDWLTGTLDWHSRTIVANIPVEAAAITFAFRMLGRGTLWVDDAKVANAADGGGAGGAGAAGTVSPGRGFLPSPSATLPTAPQNLDFETWGGGGAC